MTFDTFWSVTHCQVALHPWAWLSNIWILAVHVCRDSQYTTWSQFAIITQSTGHVLVKLRMPPTNGTKSYSPPHSTSLTSVLLGNAHVPSSHGTSSTSTYVRLCMAGDICIISQGTWPIHWPAQARSSEAVVPHCLQPHHQPADHDHPGAVAIVRT